MSLGHQRTFLDVHFSPNDVIRMSRNRTQKLVTRRRLHIAAIVGGAVAVTVIVTGILTRWWQRRV